MMLYIIFYLFIYTTTTTAVYSLKPSIYYLYIESIHSHTNHTNIIFIYTPITPLYHLPPHTQIQRHRLRALSRDDVHWYAGPVLYLQHVRRAGLVGERCSAGPHYCTEY